MSFLQKLSRLLLSLSAPKGFAAAGNSSTQACQSLSTSLPGHVSFSHDRVYEDSISSYAYIGTRLRPTCLVTPKSADDVAIIVKILSGFDSVAFAVRSGGHNTNKGMRMADLDGLFHTNIAGFADVADGVTIDLSAMNDLVIKRSTNIISVGTGARWQSVYDALDPYNLSVQGGRNGHVGVGGYLLGGMYIQPLLSVPNNSDHH
jgi:FAD/FMN-containing dehydrogenase